MTLKLSALSPILCLVFALLVSACGNKGELFLVPDDFSQQDLLRLEQALAAENALMIEEKPDLEGEDERKKDKPKNEPSS